MFRLARWIGAVVGCGSLVATATAEPRLTVHATGSASGGYTDNTLSAPDAGGADQREADVFTDLAPSVLLVLDTPRTLNEVSYGLRLQLFADSDNASSLNHQANWRGIFLTSPLSQLSVDAQFRSGQTNALATDGTAEGSQLGVLPFGSDSVVVGEAVERYRRQLDPAWSVEQTGVLQVRTVSGPASDSRGIEAGIGGGGSYTARRTEIGASVGGRFIDLSFETMAEDFEQQAVLGDLRAFASRDLGRRWNLRAELGSRVLVPADGSFSTTIEPVGVVSVSYLDRRGALSFDARHTLEPSLFVARNTRSDRVALRGRLPIPIWLDANNRARLVMNGSLGYQRIETLVLEDNSTEAETDVYLGDVAVQWLFTPDVWVMLRYQYRDQRVDSVLENAIPSFDRSSVIASIFGTYPRRTEQPEDSRTLRLDERNPIQEGRQ